MTPTQFTAWLEGFLHSVDTVPTETQWQTITAKLDIVTDEPKGKQAPIAAPKRNHR
jgi:hypothetical protein